MATKNRQAEVVSALANLLANTYVLYLKTQNYHWNVTGPNFNSLHLFFQGIYEELATANDTLAERIRALGEKAPASFSSFTKLSEIKEENGTPNATQMIKNLTKDHDTIIEVANALFTAAENAGDEASMDLAIQRLDIHQKNHWMLKAHLE